jgi:isopentenyl-diphosphate delta-isomerase
MSNLLVVVDKNDKVLGYKTKEECHRVKGRLHRAFSIFIFSKAGQLLLQKRSNKKLLWPLVWSNSCCSHPQKGEDIKIASQKRLKEELGFNCPLKFLGKNLYKSTFGKVGSEEEITYVFKGEYNGEIRFSEEEVQSIRWLNLKKLKTEIKNKPENFTPWLKSILSAGILR